MPKFTNRYIQTCRNKEVRALFFIVYLLLFSWPFFTGTPTSLWHLYIYYHCVWAILIIGLGIQGYIVQSTDRPRDGEPDD